MESAQGDGLTSAPQDFLARRHALLRRHSPRNRLAILLAATPAFLILCSAASLIIKYARK